MKHALLSRPGRHRGGPRRHALLLALLIVATTGCQEIGFLGSMLESGRRTIEHEAQYTALHDKSVAVLVAADDTLLFHHPGAPLIVSRAVSARLADNVESLRLMDPQQVIAYQQDNPHWYAIPYSELIQAMGVDTIVLIDLIEYRTHEPGNAHVWRGVVSANVGVIERDAPAPDDFTFYTSVGIQFPEEETVGVLNSDDQTIQLGMVSIFSRDAAGLFYDYEYVIEK